MPKSGKLIARLGSGSGAKAEPKKEDAPAEKEEAPAEKAEAPAASGGTSMEIKVPNVGESVSEVTVASWMKQPGDCRRQRRSYRRAGNR